MAKMTEERAPRFESGRTLQIAGLGGRFGNHNRERIPALWQRFGPQYFGRVPGQVDKKSYGVCQNMDEAGNVDYLAGVEVSSLAGLPAELMQLTIAPQRYAVFTHGGHVSEISRAWMDIFDIGCRGRDAKSQRRRASNAIARPSTPLQSATWRFGSLSRSRQICKE
jgi:AraC family transcriptional regulator